MDLALISYNSLYAFVDIKNIYNNNNNNNNKFAEKYTLIHAY